MTQKKNHFRATMTLTEAIWQTVNRGRLTPEQLEDEIDYSASALKRAGLDGESGAGFNLRKLVPLMKAQGDFTIIEHLAHRCGFLLITIPRGGKSKQSRVTSIAEYQKLTAVAVDALVKYNSESMSQTETVDNLHSMLKGTAEMIEDVKQGNQIELELYGEK